MRRRWVVRLARVMALLAVVAALPGWRPVPAAATGEAGTFVSLRPARILDTRKSLGAGGPVGANRTIYVQVTGRAGVPGSGVAAVVLNVTVTDATSAGYITVYPDQTTRPTASNLNYPRGDTRANLVTVKLGPTGRSRWPTAAVARCSWWPMWRATTWQGFRRFPARSCR